MSSDLATGIGPAGARVLIFRKEALWVHPSNAVAAPVLEHECEALGMHVEISDDASLFTRTNLERFDVVVFSLTSGETLNAAERQAFHAWFINHGSFVGIHSASYTDITDPFMVEMIGATFKTHPPVASATVNVVDTKHPITQGLGTKFRREDEWYTFERRPEDNPQVHVLLTLDEQSAHPNYFGADASPGLSVGYHPHTWTIERTSSRMFYTAMGHTPESWSEPPFVSMVVRAIIWAAEERARR